jgi:hypothetical protein
MERTVPFLHGSISLVAFVISLTLVLYMLITFVAGMFDIALLLSETAFMTSTERQSAFLVLNGNFLYNLAIIMVLMKANTVVTSYMRVHEISVKQVIELVIIALVLELTFQALIQRLAPVAVVDEEDEVEVVLPAIAQRPRSKRAVTPKVVKDAAHKPIPKVPRTSHKLAAK